LTNNLAQAYRRNILRLQASARGGQVIGLVGLIFSESEAEIEPIIADAPRTGLPCPAGQRLAAQGWGRRRYSPPWALVEQALACARQASVQSTVGVRYLSVRPVARNLDAIGFFYRAGFELLGRVELGICDRRSWRAGSRGRKYFAMTAVQNTASAVQNTAKRAVTKRPFTAGGYLNSRRIIMAQPIYQVDGFTDKPFAGNPAGVCILPKKVSEEWMKAVAREMNLSETAFLLPQEDAGQANVADIASRAADKASQAGKESQPGKEKQWFNLRWFTPVTEVDLCGHATLASAHILWETGRLLPDQQARFHTRSGMLTADRRGDWIEMNFPSKPEQPATIPIDFPSVLGAQPKYVGRNQFDYLVELENEAVLRDLKPDFVRLAKMPVRGVIVTCLPDDPEKFDFISRFFAPAVGVDEDPVTGSAHCCLGWFWGKRLGKTEMTAYQASARGGVVKVRLAGDRVILSGQAVTVLRGEILSN